MSQTLRIWTDTESVECKQYQEGYDYDEVSEALRFKAQNIKAHADPELFSTASRMLASVAEYAEHIARHCREKYSPKSGHWIAQGLDIARCSNCGKVRVGNSASVLSTIAPFCEKCGSIMNEVIK